MKTRVLVTGANGQLGKTLRAISSSYNKTVDFCFVDKTQLDITKPDDVISFFNNNSFDYCINCAAYTNVDLAESDVENAMNVNAYAVKNLASICKAQGTILIHISTDYVFDGKHQEPYLEGDLINPINIYGKSKCLGEEFIQDQMSDYFIIRTSWLYSEFNKNFVKSVFNKLKAGEKLKILTSQKGTPTSCEDLSNFIIFLIMNTVKDFGIYHFSATGETTWYNLGLHIANYLNKHSNVSPVKVYETKAKRPQYSVLSNKKVNSLTQLTPPLWQVSVNKVLKSLSKD